MRTTKSHKRLQPRKSSHTFTEDEMMGIGSFAASSSSSSSSSNLSPLAPPFTVERSNHNKLNLSSNRDSHFNSTSDGVPFTSPWPQFHSSTARQGLLADSIRTATVPSANSYMVPELINSSTTYNWDALNSVIKSGLDPINSPAMNPNPQPINAPAPQSSAINPNPQRVIDSSSYNRTEPFYYPCVSWSSDEDDALLAPLNEDFLHNRGLFHGCGSSQVDYSQNLSGLKYNAPQVGTWGGLADGSRGKNLDSEHSFFSEEANIAGSLACRSYMNQGAYDVDTLIKGKEESAVFPGRHSNLAREKNAGPSINGKSQGASFSAANQGLAPNGFSKELTFTAFPEFSESHPLVPSLEPPKEPWNSHSAYAPYGTRSLFDCYSNPKPPSITKSLPSVVIKPPAPLSTFSAQGAVSTKNVEISSTAAFNSNDVLVTHNPLKEKESRLPLGFEAKGSSLALNQLSFQIGRTDDHALVDSSTMRDASNKTSTDGRLDFKFKSISNLQFPDISITKDGKSAGNMSEHLDHHNPAEDSPCWKGAPTHFSPFGSPEAEPPQHPKKKLHENGVSNERILASTATEKDHKFGEAVVVGFDSAEASKGQAQSSCDMAKERKDYSFLSEPSSDANSQASTLKLPNVNEDVLLSGMRIRSTDGIVGQTLHASIENAANHASAENLDVNVIVKALNNLSELLLLHCSKNECGLKEQDLNALDHIVGNLNVCMSRKIQQGPPTQNYTLPQHISSNVLQEGAYVGKSPVPNGTTGIFHDALHLERNNYHFGKNIEKLQGADSLRDIDLQKDHNMVQTIKKVLDENLEYKEDLPSQNLLYKNLWLEAEAELCALSYRARFHRVKREMTKSEGSVSDVSEVGSYIKKISSSNVFPIAPKPIHEAAGSKASNIPAHNPSLPNVDGHIDDVESSVMARFNILKRRGESKPVNTAEKEHVDVDVAGNEIQSSGVAEGPHLQHDHGTDDAVVMHSHGNQKMQHPLALGTEDVEHSVKARLKILKSRGESDPVNVEWQALADGAHFQHQAGKEEKVGTGSGGTITSVMQNRFESGLYSPSYNASSDWEHVLKDEFFLTE